jgi:hypothetical protein
MRFSFVLLLILFSCRSPQKLIQIALKRDPGIVICQPDTVIKKIETFSATGYDSIKFDNSRIKINVFGNGSLKLFWELKPDTVIINNTPVITPKSTVRQVERTKREEIKQGNKTERIEIKQNNKTERKREITERKRIKSWFFEFISTLLILIGLIVFLVWKRIR